MFRTLRTVALLSICAAFAFNALAQTSAPSGLLAAIAATRAAEADYAFDYHLQSSKQNWRANYNPAREAPRLHLVEPTRESLDNGQRRAFDGLAEQLDGIAWCADQKIAQVANVRLLREDAETATYSFQPTRESVSGDTGRFVQHLRGELTLTKINPDVTAVRIYSPAAFSPIPLTQIASLNMQTRCAVAPNGRRYVAEVVTDVRGSAFGQNFNERSVQGTSNLSAP